MYMHYNNNIMYIDMKMLDIYIYMIYFAYILECVQ